MAKKNQRLGNKEQIDSDQRGKRRGNGGKKGKGQVKEHVYKEPMDKDNVGAGED